MSKSNGSKATWQQLYEAAVLETDSEKLPGLIAALEDALVLRQQQLAEASDAHEELSAMKAAARRLLFLKTERLGWPDIDQTGSN